LIRVLRRFRRKIMWVKNCIKHRLSLMGGNSYRNAFLIIIGAVIHSRDGAIAYVQAGKPACGS